MVSPADFFARGLMFYRRFSCANFLPELIPPFCSLPPCCALNTWCGSAWSLRTTYQGWINHAKGKKRWLQGMWSAMVKAKGCRYPFKQIVRICAPPTGCWTSIFLGRWTGTVFSFWFGGEPDYRGTLDYARVSPTRWWYPVHKPSHFQLVWVPDGMSCWGG